MVVIEGVSKVRPNSKVTSQQADMAKFASDQLAVQATTGSKPETAGSEGKGTPGSKSGTGQSTPPGKGPAQAATPKSNE